MNSGRDISQNVLTALEHKRGYAGYWSWIKDKSMVEKMVVEHVIGRLILRGELEPNGSVLLQKNDPPDCVYSTIGGDDYAVEVTELVHEPSVREHERSKRGAAKGIQPPTHAPLHEWTAPELQKAIAERVQRKSQGLGKHCRAIEHWLVIHTGEEHLSHLRNLVQLLGDDPLKELCGWDAVFLLAPYDPWIRDHPLLRFRASSDGVGFELLCEES